jgi:AcrR family transcriptional regulator
MNGFEKRRLKKKNSILIAALTLFKQYGYRKVTVAEIADKASVSQVSIYNYFKSKENLKQELLIKLMDDYYLEISNILESTDYIELKLEKLLLSMVDVVKRSSMQFLLESVANDTFVNKYILEKREKIKNLIVNFVEEGKKDDIIDDSVSTNAIAIYIEIFQYYFNNNPSVITKFENNPELFMEVHSLFLKGLVSKLKLNI